MFFSSMTLIWAFFATKFIALDEDVEYDAYSSNFDNIGTSFLIFYGLISFDLYPNALLPAL